MKLFVSITTLFGILLGLAAAAQLSNNYLPPPPPSAGSAGGHGSFLNGPSIGGGGGGAGGHHGGGGGGGSPSNQYIPPKTSFNQQGQPVQWSHGGWNQGGAGGQQSYQSGAGAGHRYSGSAQSSVAGYSNSPLSYQQPQKPQVPILRLENENDGNGNYHFDYQTGDGISHQQQGHINNPNTDWAENVVQGQYSYTGDDGKQYTVSYKADGNGFQAVGDHLPTPPPQPKEIQEVWNRVLAEQAAAGNGDWQQGAGGYQQGGHGGASSGQYGGGSSSGHYGGGSAGAGGHYSGSAQSGTSWQQQQGFGSGAGRPQHGGAAGGFGAGRPQHGGAGGGFGAGRPQKPQNQYLPPNSGAGSDGYHY